MRAPWGRSSRPALVEAMSTSEGSARRGTGPMHSPPGSSAGMSFMLCTARSMPTVEQGLFDLLDEEPLAADLGQGDIEDLVTTGLDDRQAHVAGGVHAADLVANPLGLPQGELAAAGADVQPGPHQWPQLVQLVAEQPLQAFVPADLATVWPPPPLADEAAGGQQPLDLAPLAVGAAVGGFPRRKRGIRSPCRTFHSGIRRWACVFPGGCGF